MLCDTHEAMGRAMELADENTNLTKELKHAEKDCSDTADVLNQTLVQTRVSLST